MDMSFGISSNVLVAGPTGNGKTYFLTALIKEINGKREPEAIIYIDDPKWFEYRRLINGESIRSYEEKEVTRLVESRLLAKKENKDAEFPSIYVVLEEISHRLNWLKEVDEKDEDNEIGDKLLSLCDRAVSKKANVHLLCASQVPQVLLSSAQIRGKFDFLALCSFNKENPFGENYYSMPWQENLKSVAEPIAKEDSGERHICVFRLKGQE